MIIIESTEADVRVTIPKGDVPPDRLNIILDWLRLESTMRDGALSEEEAERLAEDAKADWWAANKARFVKAGA